MPLDQHAAKARFPQDTNPIVLAVEPQRELLLQRFHKLAQIPHAPQVARPQLGEHIPADPLCLGKLPLDRDHAVRRIERAAAVQDLRIRQIDLRPRRHGK